MKLSKMFLRYFPPGIALEYDNDGALEQKMIDLFKLNSSSNLEKVANEIMQQEPIITQKNKAALISSLNKLQKNIIEDCKRTYSLHKIMKHILPVTNIAFNKEGTRCLSGSFDRTCKVWDIESGQLYLTLDGHNNVVYDVAFNHPYSDRILTTSFDRTACVWDSETGDHLLSLWGHMGEVVVIKYDDNKQHIATGSMDKTGKVFDMNTGLELWKLSGHKHAIVKLEYSTDGRQIITGSFDSQVFLWDTRTKSIVGEFKCHKKPVTNCQFNYDCSTVATSSFDGTAKIYDLKTLKCRSTIYHGEDVVDISFDTVGQRLATCGSDAICKVWDINQTITPLSTLIGHEAEITQVCFSPGGGLVLTGSVDNTARIWNADTGDCCQVLEGHTDEIFTCKFTYDGSTIVTASKDNTCLLWKAQKKEVFKKLEDVKKKISLTTEINKKDITENNTMSV